MTIAISVPSKLRAVRAFRSPARAFAGSTVVTFANQMAMVVSGVFVARLLGPGDRGRLALLVLFATIVTQLGSLGMPSSLTFWIASRPQHAMASTKGLRRFVSWQVPVLIGVQSIVLFAALGSTSGYERSAAALSLVSIPAIIGWQYGLAVLQGLRRFRPWNLCRLVFPAGYAACVIALYAFDIADLRVVVITWTAFLWVAAGSAVLAAFRALTAIESTEASNPSGSDAGTNTNHSSTASMLRFGLKALLGSVSPLQSFSLDQAVVGLFISPVALGIYAVAVSFTNLPFFVAQTVGAIAFPNIAAATTRRSVCRAIAVSVLAILLFAGVLGLLLEIALPWLVPLLFGPAFKPAVGVARILVVYGVLVSLRRVLGDCARGAGLPLLSSVDEVTALICMIPAVWILVGKGVEGVALAMVISAAAGLTVIAIGLTVALRRSPVRRHNLAEHVRS